MAGTIEQILALRLRERDEIAAAISGYLVALRDMTLAQALNDVAIARLEREIKHGKEN